MSNRTLHHHNLTAAILNPERVKLIVVDSFCGAGGWTEGVEQATTADGCRLAVVVAGVNHDPGAIAVHAENHPETVHFVEDVRDQTLPKRILAVVQQARQTYPNAKLLFHASLECTNFSNAKGGKPRDADSRSLAEHMHMYVEALQPDLFTIENVREFMAWGPLKDGKPESRTKGRDYQRWVREICEYGYVFDHRLLNAADFGAYTSRLRFFGIFSRPDLSIAWPAPTHSRNPAKQPGLFDGLQKWKPVRDVLDFSDSGESIFTRAKPLSEKTLERIYAGLLKHVANTDESAFLVKYLGNSAETGINNGVSVDGPAIALTTQNRLYLAQACFLSKYYSGDPDQKNIGVNGPAGAMTTTDSHSLVTAFIVQRQNDRDSQTIGLDRPARTITTTGGNQELVTAFLTSYYNGSVCTGSTDAPAPTLSTKDRVAVVQAHFIDQQYGKSEPAPVDAPAGTLTGNRAADRPKLALVEVKGFLTNPGWFGNNAPLDGPACTLVARQDKSPVALVQCEAFMVNYYSGGGQTESVDGPTTALMTIPKQRLVQCESFLLNNQHSNVPKSVDEPAPTILTGNHHYLLNAQFDHILQSIDETAPTITADRHYPYLVTTNATVAVAVPVLATDSPAMTKIKEFMAYFGILDIKMRMLKVPELKRIQGFPENYILRGTQTNMKKYIGNSVVPNVPRRWVEALAVSL